LSREKKIFQKIIFDFFLPRFHGKNSKKTPFFCADITKKWGGF